MVVPSGSAERELGRYEALRELLVNDGDLNDFLDGLCPDCLLSIKDELLDISSFYSFQILHLNLLKESSQSSPGPESSSSSSLSESSLMVKEKKRSEERKEKISKLERETQDLETELDQKHNLYYKNLFFFQSAQHTLQQSANETEGEILELEEEIRSWVSRQARVRIGSKRLEGSEGLKDLMQIDVFNEIGLIMGMRLGSDPDSPTPLEEINAALGHVCFAIHTLCQLLDFQFSMYVVIPRGSRSRIKRFDDNTVFQMYEERDQSQSWLLLSFIEPAFDGALSVLLTCVSEICRKCNQENEGPISDHLFPIKNDLIDSLTIKKYKAESVKKWSEALRKMLINLDCVCNWVDFEFRSLSQDG